MAKAAAALTVEHLGASEWNDSLADGYSPTGRPEMLAVFTTQELMFELTRAAVIAQNLPRTALLRPPAQVGVGGPFQAAGVPLREGDPTLGEPSAVTATRRARASTAVPLAGADQE